MRARTKRKLALLNRVARLRDVERLSAMRDAADKSAVHARLEALGARMGEFGVGRPKDAQPAAVLQNNAAFTAALQRLALDTAGQTSRARNEVSAAMERLGTAQHRRDTVRERATELSQTLEMELPNSASPDLARKLNSRSKPGAGSRARSRNAK